MCFVTVDFLRKVKWYVVTTVRNGFISLALTLVYQMRMTGFAVVVVVDCLHDLILFMQHNIIIIMMMMMILYKPQSSVYALNKL